MAVSSLSGHALFIAIFTLHFSAHISCSSPAKTLHNDPNTQFVMTACNCTRYPTLCYESLLEYADQINSDPKLLALTALNVSLIATNSTSELMKEMSTVYDSLAIQDCVELVSDAVYRLQMSIAEMSQASGSKENVKTWVSAALTDSTTCMDGLDEQAVDVDVDLKIREPMLKISRLTSNALALVIYYASSQAKISLTSY